MPASNHIRRRSVVALLTVAAVLALGAITAPAASASSNVATD
jgi:hypothetical protein